MFILSYTVGQNKNNWFLPVLGQARLFWMNLTGSTCQMPIYTMYTYMKPSNPNLLPSLTKRYVRDRTIRAAISYKDEIQLIQLNRWNSGQQYYSYCSNSVKLLFSVSPSRLAFSLRVTRLMLHLLIQFEHFPVKESLT